MRQAGVLAAAGLYALEHHVARLADDHAHARLLAEGLQRCGFEVDPAPETNMVVFNVRDTRAFLAATRERKLLMNPVIEGRFRAVTHLDVTRADIEEAVGRIEEVAKCGVR
jgi:threonine aldolase